MGRIHYSKRPDRQRDGRAALGQAMAAVRQRLRLQQLRARKRRPADAARVRQRRHRPFATRSTPADVAVFSIGAYDPWILQSCQSRTGLGDVIGTRALPLPIHWGTFKLSREPMEEPLQRLIKDAGDQQDRSYCAKSAEPGRCPRRSRRARPPAARTIKFLTASTSCAGVLSPVQLISRGALTI